MQKVYRWKSFFRCVCKKFNIIGSQHKQFATFQIFLWIPFLRVAVRIFPFYTVIHSMIFETRRYKFLCILLSKQTRLKISMEIFFRVTAVKRFVIFNSSIFGKPFCFRFETSYEKEIPTLSGEGIGIFA